ncbi:MAG: hypothetical protein RL685_6180 [Pseudomonadota bacterium]|jgi:2-iminobutanoate/2-iminopropanoate deaminase
MLQRKNYTELGEPVGPYVHAVHCNGLLFLSGVTAFGTPAAQGDIGQQARACFAQIARIAAAEGTTLSSLVKVTLFVTSFQDIRALRAALFETYGAELPASSLVRVAGLFAPELSIEVEGILALEPR